MKTEKLSSGQLFELSAALLFTGLISIRPLFFLLETFGGF